MNNMQRGCDHVAKDRELTGLAGMQLSVHCQLRGGRRIEESRTRLQPRKRCVGGGRVGGAVRFFSRHSVGDMWTCRVF